MKKIIFIFVKILPMITMAQFFLGSKNRVNPAVDLVKVSFTQYELTMITKLVVENYNQDKLLIHPDDFGAFIGDKFYNNYSKMIRDLIPGTKEDLSLDIWGNPFFMTANKDASHIKIVSNGIDEKRGTKDDIVVDFTIQRVNPQLQQAAKAVAQANKIIAEQEEMIAKIDTQDSYGNNLDEIVFDEDGYDQNGIHISEYQADGVEIVE